MIGSPSCLVSRSKHTWYQCSGEASIDGWMHPSVPHTPTPAEAVMLRSAAEDILWLADSKRNFADRFKKQCRLVHGWAIACWIDDVKQCQHTKNSKSFHLTFSLAKRLGLTSTEFRKILTDCRGCWSDAFNLQMVWEHQNRRWTKCIQKWVAALPGKDLSEPQTPPTIPWTMRDRYLHNVVMSVRDDQRMLEAEWQHNMFHLQSSAIYFTTRELYESRSLTKGMV